MFSASYHVRVLACAPMVQVANRVLSDTCVQAMGNIELLPLARRRGQICRLLDRVLADMGSDLRASEMSAKNQAGLEAHDWPRNFDDVREIARHLDLVHRSGSLRKAAEAANLPLSSFHYLLEKFGVSTPLIAKAAKV